MNYELGDIIKIPESFEPVEVQKDQDNVLFVQAPQKRIYVIFNYIKLFKESNINKFKFKYY